MPLKKIAFITNPGAGVKKEQAISSALALLRKHMETDYILTGHRGHATELAKIHGADPDTLVAICGGDGTVLEALNGLPPQGVMGILPGGTANVVAKELGIPLELREAAKVLLSGAIQRLDTAQVQAGETIPPRKFLMVGGFGFDAHVASMVPGFFKRILGQYAYHLEVFKRFPGYTPPRISLFVDGKGPYQGSFALLANMRRYGGNLFFAPEARYNDGLLDLVLFRDFRFRLLFRGAAEAWLRKGVSESLAYRLRGKLFRFVFDRPTPFQLDGEVFSPVGQASVSVLPASLQMVTP